MSGQDVSPNSPPTFWKRARTTIVAHPVLAVLVAAGLASAAIALTYTTTSTVTTGVTPVPVQFVAGDDSGPSTLTDYVSAYTISTNKTYITATVNGVPEASLAVGSFTKLQNVDDASHSVTLSTTQVVNSYVAQYELAIYNSADALQDTLNMTVASPSASITIPAGETFYATLTLRLGSGAGIDNVALTNAVTLSVS